MRLVPFLFAGALALLAAAGAAHIVDGVNFDELDLGNGEHLHHGMYAKPDPEIVTSLEELYPGFVGGRRIVVARFHYELPATGYDEDAKAYLVADGRALHVADVGSFSLFDDGGPYPDRWLFVSFSGGKLYTDVWNVSNRCKGQRDWTASTYGIRNGKLVRIYQVQHHRAGVRVACADPPYTTPGPDIVHYNAAAAYDQHGQYALAASEWSKVLALEGAQAGSDTLVARATDYLELGRFAQALADYNEAAKSSNDYWLHWGRARVYMYTGKFDLALADLNAAVQLNTKETAPEYSGGAFEERGTFYFARREFADAAKDFSQSNTLKPTVESTLLYHLALERSGQEDPKQFGALFEAMDRSKWPACAAHFFTAEYDRSRGQLQAARAEFERTQTSCKRWDFERYVSQAELGPQ